MYVLNSSILCDCSGGPRAVVIGNKHQLGAVVHTERSTPTRQPHDSTQIRARSTEAFSRRFAPARPNRRHGDQGQDICFSYQSNRRLYLNLQCNYMYESL